MRACKVKRSLGHPRTMSAPWMGVWTAGRRAVPERAFADAKARSGRAFLQAFPTRLAQHGTSFYEHG
eukprot:5405444-Alexandrium_andersonii.AAC.1